MFTNLRALRETEGATQAEYARRLGLSVATYAPIENGLLQPSPRIIALLERVFDRDVSFLLGALRVNS